jgi:hypothetical protein
MPIELDMMLATAAEVQEGVGLAAGFTGLRHEHRRPDREGRVAEVP